MSIRGVYLEDIMIIIGLVTAVISLFAVLVPFFHKKKYDNLNTITVKGKHNNVHQNNSRNISNNYYVTNENNSITHISAPSSNNSKNESSNDVWVFIVILFILFGLLYENRTIFFNIIFLSLILSIVLSAIISIFDFKRGNIIFINSQKYLQYIFMLTPFIISFIIFLQHKLLVDNIQIVTTEDKIKIAFIIFFNCLSLLTILIPQIFILTSQYIMLIRLRKRMQAISKLWAISIIFSLIPILIYYLPKLTIS